MQLLMMWVLKSVPKSRVMEQNFFNYRTIFHRCTNFIFLCFDFWLYLVTIFLKKDYFVFLKLPSQNKFFHPIEIFFQTFYPMAILFSTFHPIEIFFQTFYPMAILFFYFSSYGSQKSKHRNMKLVHR